MNTNRISYWVTTVKGENSTVILETDEFILRSLEKKHFENESQF